MVAFWILNSDRSPLWRAIDRRPRRLEAAELTERFDGLVRFGLEGAFLGIRERRSGEEVRFVKRLDPPGFSFDVRIDTAQPESELQGRIDNAITPLGVRMGATFVRRNDSNPGIAMHLSGEALGDPVALEGFASLLIRCLGHPDEARYRILFEGPSDQEAVREYFGLSK